MKTAVVVCSDCTSTNPAFNPCLRTTSFRSLVRLLISSLSRVLYTMVSKYICSAAVGRTSGIIFVTLAWAVFIVTFLRICTRFSALYWMPHRHPSCSYKSIIAANEATRAESGVRMGFVIHSHQLFDTCLRVALGSGEGDVAEKLLNRAQVRAIRQKMGGERVAQRVRMQFPVHIREPRVRFHNYANRFGGQPAAAVIQKNSRRIGFRAWMRQKLFAQRQVSFQRLLRFSAVGNHALFAALSQHANHLPRAIQVPQREADKLADADPRSV